MNCANPARRNRRSIIIGCCKILCYNAPTMRQTNTRLMVEQKPLSVIDVLTAGFEIVRKRPWTMLIPFLLDAAIWILPKLSLGALVRPIVPIAAEAFIDYNFQSLHLSRLEVDAIKSDRKSVV